MTTSTITATNLHHPIYRNTNNFILFVSLILFCSVPLISCKSDEKGNRVDASGELAKQMTSSHNSEQSNNEWKSEKAENEELHPQLFAAYHESYITKAAAKDFRKKIRLHKKPITEQDYNDLLQDIVLKPINKPKNDIYEKKYFDYLPTEEDIDFDTDDDSYDYRFDFDGITNNSELGDDFNEYDVFSDQANENFLEKMSRIQRSKRDIKEDNERFIGNEKRHAVLDQSRHQTVPITFYMSRERQQPINPLTVGTAVYNDLNQNNPWNNRFYQRPSNPFSIGIPGQYHNVGEPPVNAAPNSSTESPTPASYIGTRFGEPVWDYDEMPQVQANSIPSGSKDGSRQPTTRRPPPPLIHNSDETRPGIPEQRPPQNTQGINERDGSRQPTTRRPPPPLIHNSDETRPGIPEQRPSQNTQGINERGKTAAPPTQRLTTTTRRPPPSLIHNSDSQSPQDIERRPSQITSNLLGTNRQAEVESLTVEGGSGFGVGASVGAPVWSSTEDDVIQSNPTFVNQRPQQIDAPISQLGPSRCVWGIVNCCSRRDVNIRYSCFERIGCQGAFWDLNPCGNDILDAAIGETDQYFN